jgi:hypothetical protein
VPAIVIPEDAGSLLGEVEEGADGNDGANAIPKVPRVQVGIDLKDRVVQDLAQEIGCLIGV